MELGLSGRPITDLDLGYTIALEIDKYYEIRTGRPFLLSTENGDFFYTPAENPEGDLDRLRELVGVLVKSAIAEESGELVLNFENGSLLRIKPDEFYEAWTVSGPRGFLIVCMPRGELAIWDEQPTE